MLPEQYRIMVVDDEPAIAEGIADTLAALTGHIYHPFSNALQALAAYTARPYNLVLTDVTMPGLSGFELVAKMKIAHPGTDFIVITAHKSKDVVYQAHILGAANILYKPLNMEELETAVHDCHRKFLTWQGRFQEVSFINQNFT
ncbi:MAG: response regulator [Thermodesulfobacteriota bacterium]